MSNYHAANGRLTSALLALAFAGLSGTASAGAAQGYSYQSLDYPGSSQTIFWGINDFGELGGQYVVNGEAPHAMVYRHGQFERLDPDALGTYFSAAGGPNDLGVTYGAYADAAGVQHGFVLRRNKLETVDFPGHLDSNVDGINLFNQILGVYWEADGVFHGMLRSPGGVDTPFDVAGAVDTYPLGLNDAGETVGYWDINPAAPVPHGFIREANGTITTLDVPGALATVAFAINDVGQIAGYYLDASAVWHSFVRTRGQFQTLDVPGGVNGTFATTINNFGVVSGDYRDAAGQRHGFIARPQAGR